MANHFVRLVIIRIHLHLRLLPIFLSFSIFSRSLVHGLQVIIVPQAKFHLLQQFLLLFEQLGYGEFGLFGFFLKVIDFGE